MWQKYYAPHTLEDALELLDKYKERARLIAGGTDVLTDIVHGGRPPHTLIDISRIPNLDTIFQAPQGQIHLGPLVTHNQVVNSALCVDRAFPLAKACWEIGSPQIRNRATIAGNLATASPANDTIPPLWVMNGSITLQSVRGSRTLPLTEFFQGVRETAREPDEMIVDIIFSPLGDAQVGTFLKAGLRRSQAISVVNVAVVLTLLADTVTQARISLGSVSPTIVRAQDAERFLTGKVLTKDVIGRAGVLAGQTIAPISDVRGSAEYRRYMAATLTSHALVALAEGTERDTIPPRPIMLWGQTGGHFPPASAETDREFAAGSKEQPIITTINGQEMTIYGANDKTLLRMLREDAGLIGSKEGCAEGECGACTVLMDGIAVVSCLVPAPRAHGSEILTIEGLAEGDKLHPVQQAFVDEGAVQCGYCTPGFIMSGVSLLEERKYPTRDEFKQAIAGNLCRCTGYYKILQALEKASEMSP